MKRTSVKISFNPSLPILLFLIFLVLKLTQKIDWSWWWVISPLWIVAGLQLILIALFAMVFVRIKNRLKKEFKSTRLWKDF